MMMVSSAAHPTVSVIIPLYNAEVFLAQAIESVLGQTHPPQQVLVIDDGSTDQSAQIARRYGAAVQLVQQPNAGGAQARNRGVTLAQGDLLAFLDNDDWWAPEKLAWQLDALRQSPHLEAILGQIQPRRAHGGSVKSHELQMIRKLLLQNFQLHLQMLQRLLLS